jgi:hypothetical protein
VSSETCPAPERRDDAPEPPVRVLRDLELLEYLRRRLAAEEPAPEDD